MPLPSRPTICALVASVAAFGASPALAQQTAKTAAGTTITNTATASYHDPGGGRATVPSNTVSVRVDELIDVFVDNTDPGAIATRNGAVKQVTTYVVTNTGNGAAKADAVDADEAQVANRTNTVSLGTVPAGETRTVTFQVKVD